MLVHVDYLMPAPVLLAPFPAACTRTFSGMGFSKVCSNISSGTTCTILCNSGYSGGVVRTCIDGSFDSNFGPTCEAITCAVTNQKQGGCQIKLVCLCMYVCVRACVCVWSGGEGAVMHPMTVGRVFRNTYCQLTRIFVHRHANAPHAHLQTLTHSHVSISARYIHTIHPSIHTHTYIYKHTYMHTYSHAPTACSLMPHPAFPHRVHMWSCTHSLPDSPSIHIYIYIHPSIHPSQYIHSSIHTPGTGQGLLGVSEPDHDPSKLP